MEKKKLKTFSQLVYKSNPSEKVELPKPRKSIKIDLKGEKK